MKLFAFFFLLISPFCFAGSVEDLTAKAQSQDTLAQYQLGQRYLQGEGVDVSVNEAIYWLEQAATSGNPEAALSLANIYLEHPANSEQNDRALYWLTTLSVSGDTEAQVKIGHVYERLNRLDLAKIWYQVAAKKSEKAQNGYERILQKQFNAQRAKQISSIDHLEETVEHSSPETKRLPETASKLGDNNDDEFLYVSLLLTCLLVSGSVWHKKKIKKLNQQSNALDSHAHKESLSLKHQVQDQEKTIQQQKRQLETLYRQFKKLQASKGAPSRPQSSPQEHNIALACALFGFDPSNVPDSKEIKVRYKQLCKIYHPDRQGTQEEMKRLNTALKIILSNVNK